MDLVRGEPFEGLNRIQRRINDLFDQDIGSLSSISTTTTGVWFPPVDILESKDSYLIRAELPGMKREDFSLEAHDGWKGNSRNRQMASSTTGWNAFQASFRVLFLYHKP